MAATVGPSGRSRARAKRNSLSIAVAVSAYCSRSGGWHRSARVRRALINEVPAGESRLADRPEAKVACRRPASWPPLCASDARPSRAPHVSPAEITLLIAVFESQSAETPHLL